MCSVKKPSYTPPPPLPPPVQQRRQAKGSPQYPGANENGETLRRMIAGVATTPRGALEPVATGSVKLGGG